MGRITIRDIAEQAGVSIGTVDRVIHNRGHVDPEKEELIKTICDQAGYQPNRLAKGLILRGQNKRIAVIINSPEYNTFSKLVKKGVDAAEKEFQDYNVSFDFYFLDRNPGEQQKEYLKNMDLEKYSGMIIKPARDKEVEGLIRNIISNRMPVLICTSDTNIEGAIGFVGQNYSRDGRLAAEMLCTCFRRPLKVGVLTPRKIYSSRVERTEAFCSYLKERIGGETKTLELSPDNKEAYGEVLDFLRSTPDVEALYSHVNHVKLVLRAVRKLGLSEKIYLFTFGERESVQEWLCNDSILFAVEENPFQHGYLSGKLMMEYLLSNKRPGNRKNYMESHILLKESF